MVTYENMRELYGGNDLYTDIDQEHLVGALSGAITFKTVANPDISLIDRKPFLDLHAFIEKTFPLVHKNLTKEIINEMSLLYTWKGSDPSLKPTLFAGHLDVVPVVEETIGKWTEDPWSGKVVDGHIWGRGTLDCKDKVICLLETAEYMLAKGYTPKRDIYLAFGADEECMGLNGAGEIARLLESRGVELEFAIDEGGFADGANYGSPGTLLASITIFEKGYLDMGIKCESPGGHSARPGKGTALGAVARAIAAIEMDQFEASMWPVLEQFLTAIAPYAKEDPWKSLLANWPNDKDKVLAYFADHNVLSSFVHTTTAATMISGGSAAPNVLPQTVNAVINFRTAPGDTNDAVIERCKKAAASLGANVEIFKMKGKEASKVSSTTSDAYKLLSAQINKFFPSAVVVPNISVGATDCRFYENMTENCFRASPFLSGLLYSSGVHGVNERTVVDDIVHAVKMYIDLFLATSF